MSPRQALASVLHLFVLFAFFVSGLFFVSLPYLPQTRLQVIDLISGEFEKCTLIGLWLFLTSLLLLVGFYALNRGRYLVIQMGNAPHSPAVQKRALTEIQIIHQTLEECFQNHFSKKIALSEVEIGPHSLLEIRVKLKPLSEEAREELFIATEKQLALLLRERFGYFKPFHLIVKI